MKIRARNYNFKECLEEIILNCKKINIPAYQREYTWEEEGTRLIENCYFPQKSDKDVFVGTVYYKKISESEIDLIDGQQRITTFLMTLRLLDLIIDGYRKTIDDSDDLIDLKKYYLIINNSKLQSTKIQNSRAYDFIFCKTELKNWISTNGKLKLSDRDGQINTTIIESCWGIWQMLRDKLNIHSEEDIDSNTYETIKNLLLRQESINLVTISFAKTDKRFIFRTFRELNSTAKPLFNLELLHSAIFEMNEKKGNEFQEFLQNKLFDQMPGKKSEAKRKSLEAALVEFAIIATLESKKSENFKLSSFDVLYDYLYDYQKPEQPLREERLEHLKNYLQTYVKFMISKIDESSLPKDKIIVKKIIDYWKSINRKEYIKFLIDLVATKKDILKSRQFLVILNNISVWSALQGYKTQLKAALDGFGKPGKFDSEKLKFREIYQKIYSQNENLYNPQLPSNFRVLMDGEQIDNIPFYLNTHCEAIFGANAPELQDFYKKANYVGAKDLNQKLTEQRMSICEEIEQYKKALDKEMDDEQRPEARKELQKALEAGKKWYWNLEEHYLNTISKLFEEKQNPFTD